MWDTLCSMLKATVDVNAFHVNPHSQRSAIIPLSVKMSDLTPPHPVWFISSQSWVPRLVWKQSSSFPSFIFTTFVLCLSLNCLNLSGWEFNCVFTERTGFMESLIKFFKNTRISKLMLNKAR